MSWLQNCHTEDAGNAISTGTLECLVLLNLVIATQQLCLLQGCDHMKCTRCGKDYAYSAARVY